MSVLEKSSLSLSVRATGASCSRALADTRVGAGPRLRQDEGLDLPGAEAELGGGRRFCAPQSVSMTNDTICVGKFLH